MRWLLTPSPWLARAAMALYYRARYEGETVPRVGPVMLVANHQNALVDPILVIAAARRPVQFLAKAPLFHDWKVAWLLRAGGAIPVYRRRDDPSQVARNVDTFAAATAALSTGAAVGIFPEGVSHSEPSLSPLKTGAARMALGTRDHVETPMAIVPVGLVFRQKDVFRSEVLTVTGPSIPWDDLRGCNPKDAQAVRELTDRIERGLSGVTLNLAAWADRPLVEAAVRVWEAEQATAPPRERRLQRLSVTVQMLARVRERHDEEEMRLLGELARFERRLRRLGLRPADLSADISPRRTFMWAATRLRFAAPVAAVFALAGWLAFCVPYWGTGWIVRRAQLTPDQVSTWKLMVGAAVYLIWMAVATSGVLVVGGVSAGVTALIGMPVVGVLGLLAREQYAGMWHDVRRFVFLRSRGALTDQLRAQRRDLGRRLDQLLVKLNPA